MILNETSKRAKQVNIVGEKVEISVQKNLARTGADNAEYLLSKRTNLDDFQGLLDIWVNHGIFLLIFFAFSFQNKCAIRDLLKVYNLGSACGEVGRAVASDTRDPRFESRHWQFCKITANFKT